MATISVADLPPKYQQQVLQKLSQQAKPMPKQSKMRNIKTDLAGIKFASKKEAARFQELKLLEDTGQIRNLRLQVDFTLQEAYTTTTGKRIRAIRYKADFTYEEPAATGWVRIVEDVKGNPKRTKEYTMKRKMMQDRLGITIRET